MLEQLGGETDIEDMEDSSRRRDQGVTMLQKDKRVQNPARKEERLERPTSTMDDLWTAMAFQPDEVYVDQEPHEDITVSAAFTATASEATMLGRSYARLMQTMEAFYCTAYKIPLREMKQFCGRGRARQLQKKEMKPTDHKLP